MKVVYVCSPLKGDVETNIENAKKFCEYVMKECGAIPIAPHIYFTQFLDDSIPEDREMALKAGKELLHKCDELWCFGENITPGMLDEMFFAKVHLAKINHISDEQVEKILNKEGFIHAL